MSKEQSCAAKLKMIVGNSYDTFETFVCVVNGVNGATCQVTRVMDDKIIPDVRLNCSSDSSHGIVITPKIGSAVLVTSISEDDNFVSQFSEIEKISIVADTDIEINGGSFGGLVKIEELKTQLGKVTARIDGIIDALTNSQTAAQDGGATYKKGIVTKLNTLTDKEDFSNMEDTKCKH